MHSPESLGILGEKDLIGLSPAGRAVLPPELLRRSVQVGLEQDPRMLLQVADDAPDLFRWAEPAGVVAAWRKLVERTLADRRSHGTRGFYVLQKIPDELLAEVTPAEYAAYWTGLCEVDSLRGALELLEKVPARLLTEVDRARVLEGWRVDRRHSRGGTVRVLESLPLSLRADFPLEEVVEAYREHGRDWEERALQRLRERPSDEEEWGGRLPLPRLVLIWEGWAAAEPFEALDWLRKQKPEVREGIPATAIHTAWCALFAQEPRAALAWLERVPKKLHPALTAEDVAGFLQSDDAQVRLHAVALSSGVVGTEVSVPAAAAPQKRRTR
jgi:hypothetical protein